VNRSRTIAAAIIVATVIILAAVGIFVVQYIMESSQCAAQACPDFSGMRIAITALYAAIAGMTAAMRLASFEGFNVKRYQPPNTALARTIDLDERHLAAYQARRTQLEEWTTAAQARAAEQAAIAEEQARAWAESEAAFEAEAARWVQEDAGEEEEQQESESTRRSRVLSEHLAHLARTKPEAVAAVVSSWINQPVR
jgi:hypothetical protein